MGRKRSMENGRLSGGRLQLDRETREPIRAYTRMKFEQATSALRLAVESHQRLQCQQSAGRVAYWQHVVGYLSGLYQQGQHSVEPLEWADAWRHTTTVERMEGTPKNPEQQSLPGME